MNTILKLLSKTVAEYEIMYFGAYWRWCESVTINEPQTQMVLANASVNKYYNMEYVKCEAEFLHLIKNYPNVTPKEAMQLYFDCTLDMFNRHCAVLIKQAITNTISNDRTPTKK